MIQRYSKLDYSPLIDIWKQSVIHTHSFLSKNDYELILSKLEDYFNNVDIYVYVYMKFNRPIAFMGISNNKMEMLFCYPEYFRKGIGTSMVNYALDFLHIQYVDVNEQNIQAFEFYKSLGFIVIGRQERDAFGYTLLHLKYNGVNSI